MSPKPTIYLCDDEEEVRNSVSFYLRQAEFDIKTFASGEELLKAIKAAPKPLRAIFVLDLQIPPMDGDVIHDHLIELGYDKRNPVIFLSDKGTIPRAVEAVKKGALDFVQKPYTNDALLPLLNKAVELEALLHIKANRSDFLQSLWDSLTPREKQVAHMVADQKQNAEMASIMNIVERTVEMHRRKVHEKLGVDNAAGVANTVAALKNDGVDLESDSNISS